VKTKSWSVSVKNGNAPVIVDDTIFEGKRGLPGEEVAGMCRAGDL
jgi:hypothetical protein